MNETKRHTWIPLLAPVERWPLYWCANCGALRRNNPRDPGDVRVRAVGDRAWSEIGTDEWREGTYARCPMPTAKELYG